MNKKANIKKKIDLIDVRRLPELELFIDGLVKESHPESRTRPHDEKVYNYLLIPKIDASHEGDMQNVFIKYWEEIKTTNSITKAFIRHFENVRNPDASEVINRIGSDARHGYFFEDRFYFFLKCFLKTRAELYHRRKYVLQLELNKAVSVKTEKYKQKPDILIHNLKLNKPVRIIELKKSYTKHSVQREYNDQLQKWKSLDEKAVFDFVIFESTSKQKTKTYRDKGCKVVCYGMKKKTSPAYHPEATIVDSIENIFEDVAVQLSKY